MRKSPITSLSTSLDLRRIHTRRVCLNRYAPRSRLLPLIINVFKVESVDVAGDVAEDGEKDVDEEIGAAAGYTVDSYWWY